MPTVEETLTNISVAVSQISSDISAISEASETSAGLVKISGENNPDDNTVPTVEFFKNRNILGASGEAGGGLPQAQLDQIASLPAQEVLTALAALPSEQINALPATQILSALSALPASLTGLEGQVIAVNSSANGYELVFAPVGGGGGGSTPVNIVVDHFTGDNSTTVFTLSQAAINANALDIAVSGVSIDPADYNVAGTNLTFTAAPPATGTDEIVVRHLGNIAVLENGSVITATIADGAVTTPKVADKAITLQKMADGTPGKFLKYNASTGIIEESDVVIPNNSISTVKVIDKNITLAKLADGAPGKYLKYNESTGVIEEADVIVPDNAIITSKLFNKAVTLQKMADGTPGKFLKFNDSTGVIEESDGVAAGGGTNALILLSTQNASGSASIAFDSSVITSAYKHYIIMYNGVYGTTPPANFLYMFASANNGASYFTSYTWSAHWQNPGSPNISGQGTSSDTKIDLTAASGNFSNSPTSPASGIINLFDITTPGASVSTFLMEYNDFGFVIRGGGSFNTANINNIKIEPSSGTFTGTFKLYGVL